MVFHLHGKKNSTGTSARKKSKESFEDVKQKLEELKPIALINKIFKLLLEKRWQLFFEKPYKKSQDI